MGNESENDAALADTVPPPAAPKPPEVSLETLPISYGPPARVAELQRVLGATAR